MKNFCLSFALLFMVCAACYADSSSGTTVSKPAIIKSAGIRIRSLRKVKPARAPAAPDPFIPKKGDPISWNATPQELYVDGGVQFTVYGTTPAVTISIKYTPTGNASYTFYDVTDIANSSYFPFPTVVDGQEYQFDFAEGNSASVSHCEIEAEDCICVSNPDWPSVLHFPVKQIQAAWVANAKRYCTQHFGQSVCLIPQVVSNDIDTADEDMGYVAARPDHLLYDTEFMRMYSADKDAIEFTPYLPIGYGILARVTLYHVADDNFLLVPMDGGDYLIQLGILIDMSGDVPDYKTILDRVKADNALRFK
jgi:hypothetical protein